MTSELTWLETLTKPVQEGNTVLEGLFRSFLTAEEVRLVPVDRDLWERAARLRGLGLRTPDAIHAATAVYTACSLMVTNDSAFRRVPDLTVAVLDDFV